MNILRSVSVRGVLQRPWIIRAGQAAVTGEWRHPAHRLLAEQIRSGPHESVLDLGSGRSPLLRHLEPERYVGLDIHPPDLDYAEQRFGRAGYQFLRADILEKGLEPWQGVDVVTTSSVFHHLSDDQVVSLVDRVASQARPRRLVFLDTVATGPLGALVTRLDYGDPARPKELLYNLFSPRFDVTEAWSYDNRFRTFHVFGFELTPHA
jgi:SAM-dependent methyltransferase